MKFRTDTESLVTEVLSSSGISRERLVGMGLVADSLGVALDPGYGEFPTWLRDKLAAKFGILVGQQGDAPVWSDDVCPMCRQQLGVYANLAPDSNIHRKCAFALAESRTHDDSRECKAMGR